MPKHIFPVLKCRRNKKDRILDPVERVAPFNQPTDLLKPVLRDRDIDNRVNLVFFDIETQQNTAEHLPTLLISQTMLGEDERVFEGQHVHACVSRLPP